MEDSVWPEAGSDKARAWDLSPQSRPMKAAKAGIKSAGTGGDEGEGMGVRETLNKSFNHEWTRMNTNEIKASNRLIRVGSCPFVVKSALPMVAARRPSWVR